MVPAMERQIILASTFGCSSCVLVNQRFPKGYEKPLKRLNARSSAYHRAKAPVLMRSVALSQAFSLKRAAAVQADGVRFFEPGAVEVEFQPAGAGIKTAVGRWRAREPFGELDYGRDVEAQAGAGNRRRCCKRGTLVSPVY